MILHQKQWEFLIKSVELGRLPHALLFFGQEHLGKKKLAIDFAKSLIGPDIERGINPDFILVEPATKEIQIGQIRNLIEKLSFKPYSANFKIAVIDNAHLMTQESQNCFLKFLEEPKDKTFIILITAYPSLLLPTILSRVQKIRFFATKEFQRNEINSQFALDLNRIIRSDFATRFQYAKDLASQNLEEILDDWLEYFRGILISRLCFAEASAKASLAKTTMRQVRLDRQEKTEVFNQYSLVKLKDILNQIQLTRTLISTTNVNPRLALEILLMKL